MGNYKSSVPKENKKFLPDYKEPRHSTPNQTDRKSLQDEKKR